MDADELFKDVMNHFLIVKLQKHINQLFNYEK